MAEIITDEATVERIITSHTRPINNSIRAIELSVAKMSGSFEEHQSQVNDQLGGITKSIKETARQIGEVAGSVSHHEGEIAELFRSKDEKNKGSLFQPSHLTLSLSIGLVIVITIGTFVGVDVMGLWK